MVERVRLVIWDLDETFWKGTLTEGGVEFVESNRALVIDLARRGIVSSICSKNDYEAVRVLLTREGLWEYFVLPSVNWEPKGPRIAALIEDIQLRPETVLFVDDNPLNLIEVQHFVKGIQVENHEFVPRMAADPRFVGKDDKALTRLKQYKVLENRKADQKDAGKNIETFLRSCGISVHLEFDVLAHLDRAVELVNRTNQLNFTKQRLPEDAAQARKALQLLLSRHDIQCALVRVVDNYGDHGYAGIYALRSGVELVHFCFSCRILGMGVETWLYNRLRRPHLAIVGDVLSDPVRDCRVIDWITLRASESGFSRAPSGNEGGRVFARGGCDLQAVTHYLEMEAAEVVGEFNIGRSGFDARVDHSIFLRWAIEGLSPEALLVAKRLGYQASDFTSVIVGPGSDRFDFWLISLWADTSYALYRHTGTGVILPFSMPGQSNHRLDARLLEDGALPERFRNTPTAAAFQLLKAEFEFVGPSSEDLFKSNLRLALDRKPPQTRVVLLGPNTELWDQKQNVRHTSTVSKDLSNWMNDMAASFEHVSVVPISAFINNDDDVQDWSHFDRMVYFRLFQHLAETLNAPGARLQGPVTS